MTGYSGNFYNTTIPVNATGTGPIYYYIQSADPAGNTAYSPAAGQSGPLPITITSTTPTNIGAIVPAQGTPQHTEGRRWIDIYIYDNKTGDTQTITSMSVNLTNFAGATAVSSIRFTPAGGSYTTVSNGGNFNVGLTLIPSYSVTGTNIYIVSIEFNANVWRFGNNPQWSALGVTFYYSTHSTSMIWNTNGYVSYAAR